MGNCPGEATQPQACSEGASQLSTISRPRRGVSPSSREPYNSSRITTRDLGAPEPKSNTALRTDPKTLSPGCARTPSTEPYNGSRITTRDLGTPDSKSDTALRADPKNLVTRLRTYAQYRAIQRLKDNDPGPGNPRLQIRHCATCRYKKPCHSGAHVRPVPSHTTAQG